MVMLGTNNVASEDDIQGGKRPIPGRYHVIVKAVEYWSKTKDEKGGEKWAKCEEVDDIASKIVVTFEVLAGTMDGQVGLDLPENFHISDKAMTRLQRLALVLGLIQPNEPARNILFSEALERQLVIEVEPNKYTNFQGKVIETVRVAYYGFWSVGNKEVADVPKCEKSLKFVGVTHGNAPSPPPSTTSAAAAPPPAQPPVATAAAAAGGGDKWADL